MHQTTQLHALHRHEAFAEADVDMQVWAIWRERLPVSVPAAWAALGVMIVLLCYMRMLQSARSLPLLLL